MFLFSGIFFPLSKMPGWVKVVAWIFPLTHCVTLAQAAIHGGSSVGRILFEAAWVLVAGVGLLWIALVRIRKMYVL